MERIRIVKRKSGSGYIWGILLALIILGALAWFVMDNDLLDRTGLTASRNQIESDEYANRNGEYADRNDEYANRNYGGFDRYQRESGVVGVQEYVSFVNRRVIPAESIDDQMKQQALEHFNKAINELDKDSNTDNRNFKSHNDTLTASDTVIQKGNVERGNKSKELIDAGNKLADIQEEQFPSLAEMGRSLKKSLNQLENSRTENPRDLKEFFILSSSLFQEMESERNNGELSYNTKQKEL